MSKQDWVWMPHPGHYIRANDCKFILNTFLNGYIVSTVGEYFPDQAVRRILLQSKKNFPKLCIDINGKIVESPPIEEEEREKLLALKGDYFDNMWIRLFGYEEIGFGRKYETMVFKAEETKDPKHLCCPWKPSDWSCLDFQGYNEAPEAYRGHLEMCEKWDKEVHSSHYIAKED